MLLGVEPGPKPYALDPSLLHQPTLRLVSDAQHDRTAKLHESSTVLLPLQALIGSSSISPNLTFVQNVRAVLDHPTNCRVTDVEFLSHFSFQRGLVRPDHLLNRTHCPLDEPRCSDCLRQDWLRELWVSLHGVWRLLPSNPVTRAPDHSEEQLLHDSRTY